MANEDTIESRLKFMRFTEQDRHALSAAAPVIAVALEQGLADLYRQIELFEEPSRFFGSKADMARASGLQKKHWERITSGSFDEDYRQSARRIGATHARIGLPVRWYVGAYALVAAHLIRAVVLDFEAGRSRFMRRRDEAEQLSARLTAVMKAVFLDADISVSAFQDDAYQDLLEKLSVSLTALAKGDLTHRVTGAIGQFSKLEEDFNHSATRLEEMIAAVAEGARSLKGITAEVAAATQDLARRTERQAGSIEQTAATLSKVTENAAFAARIADEARSAARETAAEAAGANALVARAAGSMDGIERSSREISQITQMVGEISFQTNLLALNAAVEAARAGEAGRGFAVVAHEVRMLAQRSDEAAKSINHLIEASGVEVVAGAAQVRETGAVLESLVNRVNTIGNLIGEIATVTEAQARAIADVNRAISEMEGDTHHNAAMVEESTAATRQLASEAERLAGEASNFRTAPRTIQRSTPRSLAA